MKNHVKFLALTVTAICFALPTMADNYTSKHIQRNSDMRDRTMTERYEHRTADHNHMRKDHKNMNSRTQYDTLSNAEVMEVQRSLKNEGYNIQVDGVWGARTDSAIRSFQRNNNLQVTGNLDPRTLNMMDIEIPRYNQ